LRRSHWALRIHNQSAARRVVAQERSQVHVAPAVTPERVAAVIKNNAKDGLKHPVVSHLTRGRHCALVQEVFAK
jgi:hypothetical protein